MKMHLPCSNRKSRKPQTPYLILALHFALFKAVPISFYGLILPFPAPGPFLKVDIQARLIPGVMNMHRISQTPASSPPGIPEHPSGRLLIVLRT